MESDQNRGSYPSFGAKAHFIRSQPESMPARQVVEAAAAQGLKISLTHVYNLRAANAKAQLRREGQPDTRPNHPVAAERLFRAAIAEVGLARARQIFQELAEAFRAS